MDTTSANNPDLLVCVACGTEFDQPADEPLENCVICDVCYLMFPPTHLTRETSTNPPTRHTTQTNPSTQKRTTKLTNPGPAPIRPPNRPSLDLPLANFRQIHQHFHPNRHTQPQLQTLVHHHHAEIRHRPARDPNPLPSR
jgi:hypothetical protein